MIKFLVLAIGFLSPLFCYADDSIQCTEDERDLTRKFIANVRDNYCLPLSKKWRRCLNPFSASGDCPLPITKYNPIDEVYLDLLEAHQMQNLKGIDENIPHICFLTSTSFKDSFSQPGTFYQCDNNIASISEPGPCTNEEYIDLITKAFNRVANCFGFETEREKQFIFALLHHESRFLLNKIEESGETDDANRCFGQLDNGFVSDLNKYILFGDRARDGTGKPHKRSYFKYGDMYKEAHKKCPFLDKALIPHTSELKDTNLRGLPGETKFDKEHQKRKDEIICKTSQDPYPCLFYTMYGLKVSLHKIDELLSNPTLTSLTIDGESYDIFDKNDTKLRWVIAIWAHNAGKDGIINKAFPDFIKTLKGEVGESYKSCEKSSCRNSVVDGIFLSTKNLINKFTDYALQNKDGDKKVSNAEEVSEIIGKIENDLKSFNHVRGLCPFKLLD